MVWFRRRNIRFTHIALALLVLVALAPSLSRMLSFLQHESAPWSVVCSAPMAAGDASTQAGGAAGDHCPMCLTQSQAWHPGTDWSVWGLVLPLAALLPLLYLWAPRPLFAWASAQPRAPPALA